MYSYCAQTDWEGFLGNRRRWTHGTPTVVPWVGAVFSEQEPQTQGLKGAIMITVRFESCSGRSRSLYSSEDSRFRVLPDGTVSVKRQLTLHTGSVSFVLNAWDSAGKKHSVPVFIWNEREQQEARLTQ
ncbi:cadherin-1 isoform X2 [Xenopus laevis]|uniref:Cadherin-1 isoform X2 n=1 Tax=Xenopus laevis TaxID=8355 RepID=A0A8J0U7A8_XENLA|nr:cadherin-1 isoform X2 [Xenopus laevis]